VNYKSPSLGILERRYMNKIIEFNKKKADKTNILKDEYEKDTPKLDDMYWILEGYKTGKIKSVDIMFEFDTEQLYVGTTKRESLVGLQEELHDKVDRILGRARIE
jgi:hypothetical protein